MYMLHERCQADDKAVAAPRTQVNVALETVVLSSFSCCVPLSICCVWKRDSLQAGLTDFCEIGIYIPPFFGTAQEMEKESFVLCGVGTGASFA